MGGMVDYQQIACQRGCEHHPLRLVSVDLSRPHAYRDCTSVPSDLAVRFELFVYDQALVTAGAGYCPADDAVSATIVECGIWEPVETVMALRALRTARQGQWFVDMGAQIGWFTMLAVTNVVPVLAFEADQANVRTLRETLYLHRDVVHPSTMVEHVRLDERTPTCIGRPVRLLKLDVEGAEHHGLRVMRQMLEREVDFVMMEVTPEWGRYVDMVQWLIDDCGFDLYLLPDKRMPPHMIDGTRASLAPWSVDPVDVKAAVESRAQQDVWLARRTVAW